MDLDSLSMEELRERADLIREMRQHLQAIKELAEYWPDEDERMALARYLQDLRDCAELNAPTEDDMTAVADHLQNLRELEEAAA